MDKLKEKLLALTLDQTTMILEDPQMAFDDRSQAMKDLANIVGKVAELQKIENEAYEAEKKREDDSKQKDRQLIKDYVTAGISLFTVGITSLATFANIRSREKALDTIIRVQRDPDDPMLFTTPEAKGLVQNLTNFNK